MVPQTLQLRQPYLLALSQGFWPSSLRRNQWAAARVMGFPGRMPVHPWSHPHSCRWFGCALWVLPQWLQPQRRGHRLLRSHYEGPCQGGPAQHLPLPLVFMLPSDSRPPVWLPARALWVPSPMGRLRQSHGLPSPLPLRPASSSPRARRSCSWSGPCPLRTRLTSSEIWWLNFGASQSRGHPRLQRSHLKLPHLWLASPLWVPPHPPPPAFLGLSPLLLLLPPTGSLMQRTGLRGSQQRMEVSCSSWAQRSKSWVYLVQTHRKSWSDHWAPHWHC